MGCGFSKNTDIRVTQPVQKPQFLPGFEPPDWRDAQIGSYVVEQHLSEQVLRNLKKWKGFSEKNTVKQFRRRISKGPPAQFRWRAWMSFLGVEIDRSLYESFPLASGSIMHEIEKDLGRTFTEHPYFKEYTDIAQPALRRVLGKFAEKHQSIGYCQGMNSVIGFLLLVSGGSEIEVFFLFEKLCESHGLGGHFSKSLSGLQEQLIMFQKLAARQSQKVLNHLKQEDFELDYWLVQWVISLCTSRFSLQTSLRIWDNYIIDGKWFIAKLAVTYIHHNRKVIPKMAMEELIDFFSHAMITDKLIKTAVKVHISKQLVMAVKEIYDKNYTSAEAKEDTDMREPIPVESAQLQNKDLDCILKNIVVEIPERDFKRERMNHIVAFINKISI